MELSLGLSQAGEQLEELPLSKCGALGVLEWLSEWSTP